MSGLCFSDYVRWLGDNPTVEVEHNDLISALKEEDAESLDKLEALLSGAREIMGIDETQFRTCFGFANELHTPDPDKVHDVLAEPAMVASLAEQGFHTIRKLPKFIKHKGDRLPAADLTAERQGKRFAIEVKTIRTENKPRPEEGKLMGNALIPSWWREMFRSNIVTKIENKSRKLLKQLRNTKRHLSCDHAMLALYNRRMGPSTLMGTQDYREELAFILRRYQQIDHIFLKDYFGEVVIYPPL